MNRRVFLKTVPAAAVGVGISATGLVSFAGTADEPLKIGDVIACCKSRYDRKVGDLAVVRSVDGGIFTYDPIYTERRTIVLASLKTSAEWWQKFEQQPGQVWQTIDMMGTRRRVRLVELAHGWDPTPVWRAQVLEGPNDWNAGTFWSTEGLQKHGRQVA